MGDHHVGNAIGREAQLAYERRLPGEKAIDILDRICKGRGCDAEFESSDPNHPNQVHPDFEDWRYPHPKAGLGMLMVEAFAPNGLADFPNYQNMDDEDACDLWWEEIVEPFCKRYDFY